MSICTKDLRRYLPPLLLALAAPVFGLLLDHHLDGAIFFGAAAAMVLGIVSASVVGRGLARR